MPVPKVTAEEFLESDERESLNGYTADVTLYPILVEKEEE